jgi:tape measure domain-containing protein
MWFGVCFSASTIRLSSGQYICRLLVPIPDISGDNMAATDVERLIVALEARTKAFENALNRASGITNKRAQSIESRFSKMNKTIEAGFSRLGVAAAKAFALIGGAQGAKSLIDSSTRIENALKVAGLAGEDLERVYQRLYDSAQKNAAPIETLVTLYGRVAIVQKELGVSTDQLLSFTDNIALALRVAGTDAQTASGALLQLSQAMGSGVVRAEEFNSILEGALPIAQAAAAGLKEAGGSVAQLRKLVVEGKVSSEAFFRAFEAGAPTLREKVANAALTLDQRFTNLQTSLVDAAKRFNESTKAGEAFGSEIDRISGFVNTLNFDTLVEEIQKVSNALTWGTNKLNQWADALGEYSKLNRVGESAIGALPGDETVKTYFGGALSVYSGKAIQRRIDDAFGDQINDVSGLTAEAIKNSVLGNTPTVPKGGRLPSTAGSSDIKPVSIKDYAVDADGDGKKRKQRLDDYQREVRQIQERSEALRVSTQVQASINPLINDYGYAIELATAKQDLLTAAQRAGIKITPELTASIEGLAKGYADAVVASEKLAEKQDEIRQKAEDAMATAKDVTRGMIDGFIEGASAADILADSLKKIGSALLDDVLGSIFKVGSSSSGGGFLSGIFGSFGKGYSGGGYTGTGGKYEPAGVVHKGEYVFDQAAVRAAGGPAAMEVMRRALKGYSDGGPVGASVPSIPKIRHANSNGMSFSFAPVIDARGADVAAVARLEQVVAKQGAEMQGRVEAAVRSAQKRNVKLG